MASVRSMRSAFSRMVRLQQQYMQQQHVSELKSSCCVLPTYSSIAIETKKSSFTIKSQLSFSSSSLSSEASLNSGRCSTQFTPLKSTLPCSNHTFHVPTDNVAWQTLHYGSSSSTSSNRKHAHMSFVTVMPVHYFETPICMGLTIERCSTYTHTHT